MTNQEWSFDDFCMRNPSSRGFDYLNLVYQAKAIPSDFVIWLSRLFLPEFLSRDGMVFVKELFDEERYESLKVQGEPPKARQFWMNLLDLASLFPEMGEEQLLELATTLTASWNQKLKLDGNGSKEFARVVRDREQGEIFVVIGHPDEGKSVS